MNVLPLLRVMVTDDDVVVAVPVSAVQDRQPPPPVAPEGAQSLPRCRPGRSYCSSNMCQLPMPYYNSITQLDKGEPPKNY